MQTWTPAKQKDLLQAMPASTAAEVTLQLLLQNSHKWVYKAPIRAQPRPTSTALLAQHEAATALEGIAEDDVSGAAESMDQGDIYPDEGLDDEAVDEEEVESPSLLHAVFMSAEGSSHSTLHCLTYLCMYCKRCHRLALSKPGKD